MATRVHELRNRLTTAALTATAMLDGKLPADKANLRELVRALDDIRNIVATISKYDWDQTPNDKQVVDVHDLVRSVANEVELAAAAANVQFLVSTGQPGSDGSRLIRGRSREIHRALEEAVHAFIDALPGGATIVMAPASNQEVAFSVSIPGERATVAAHLAAVAPSVEGHHVRPGERLGEFLLRLPAGPPASRATKGAKSRRKPRK